MKQGHSNSPDMLNTFHAGSVAQQEIDFVSLYTDFVGGGEKTLEGLTNFNGDMVNRRGIGSGHSFYMKRSVSVFHPVFLSLIEQIVWLALSLARADMSSPIFLFSESDDTDKPILLKAPVDKTATGDKHLAVA